jgi:hypothetical protein
LKRPLFLTLLTGADECPSHKLRQNHRRCFNRTIQCRLILLAGVRWLYCGARQFYFWVCGCGDGRRPLPKAHWIVGLRHAALPYENQYAIRLNHVDGMLRQASRVFLVLKSIGLVWAICFPFAAFAQNRYQITRILRPKVPIAQR